MKRCCLLLLIALPAFGMAADIDKINGSVRVEAGEKVDNVSTVNGSVRIDDDVTVKSVETVNGSVALGRGARAEAVDNVNGSIRIGDNARVAGSVDSVNGSITLDNGADVAGKLANVNGRISLTAAHVGGGIETVGGDILIGANSRVENGIHVEKPQASWIRFGKEDVPRIEIGPGAVVEGTLRFDRKVELFVSDRATIGRVEGADPVKFSGDHPPD